MRNLLQTILSLCLLIAIPSTASAAPYDDSTTDETGCTGCTFTSSQSCNAATTVCAIELRVRVTGVSGLCLQEDAPYGPCKEEFPCRTKIKVEYKSNDIVMYGAYENGVGGYTEVFNPTFGNWAVISQVKTDMPCGHGPIVYDSFLIDVYCGGVVHCTYQVACAPCVD